MSCSHFCRASGGDQLLRDSSSFSALFRAIRTCRRRQRQIRSECKADHHAFRWEYFLIRLLRNRSYQLIKKKKKATGPCRKILLTQQHYFSITDIQLKFIHILNSVLFKVNNFFVGFSIFFFLCLYSLSFFSVLVILVLQKCNN